MNVPIMDKEEKKAQIDGLVNYFDNNFGHHKRYAMRFFICELLNLINIIGQIFFMDLFLGGQCTKLN